MKDTSAEKNAVGVKIIPLRETIFLQEKIVRLGPPPDNAGILIRGGMAWVLGILTKPIPTDPRIVRLQEPESPDQVMVALWRELAYQRIYKRGIFSISKESDKNHMDSRWAAPKFDYVRAEQMFIANAASRWPGGTQGVPDRSFPLWGGDMTDLPDEQIVSAERSACFCADSALCCAPSCSSCHKE